MPRKTKNSTRQTERLKMPYSAQLRAVEEAGNDGGPMPHPADHIEPVELSGSLQLIMAMSDRLARILQWIAAGNDGGTLDMRAWAMLYVMRPDLIKGESSRQFATRRGVDDSRVRAFVCEFRGLFPGVRFAPASRSTAAAPTPATPHKASLGREAK